MVLSQEEILLSLIQDGEGQKWAANKIGWKESSTEPACEWEDVECDNHNNVIALLLQNTSLSAYIPSEFGKLTSLRTVGFSANLLYGPIPKEFAALPNLVNVNLSYNRLSGTLPTFSSSQLQILDIGNNDLHGSIPTKITYSKDSILQVLVLSQNRFSGTIPITLSQLSNLNILDLSNNNIHGEIPSSIGDLHLLQSLKLNNNFLIGPIPSSIAISQPVNSNMADLLVHIHLHDNMLSGTIPVQLADLPNLQELLIHENKLTGDIPSDICSANINTHFWQSVSIGDETNYCDSISCPVDYVATEGVAPCARCKNPHYNPYLGQMRTCNKYTHQREILKKFYDSTNINGGWNGYDGASWSDDDIFMCDFTGVTCDENYNVISINLKNRGLTGTIPDEIGFLQYLESIDVSDNDLSGFLPSDFRWTPLKVMDISGNKIRGIIPPKLCLKDGVNGNGMNGEYDCDHIACPVGTFSVLGRKDIQFQITCRPCEHNSDPVLGLTECRQLGVASGIFGIVVLITTMMITFSFCYIIYFHKHTYIERVGDDSEIELGKRNIVTDVTDDSEESEDTNSRTTSTERNGTQKSFIVTRGGRKGKQRYLSTTRNLDIAEDLPYPDAATFNSNTQTRSINHAGGHRISASVPSGNTSIGKKNRNRSSGSGGRSVTSVASNKSGKSGKSGKFSIGSDDSNNKEIWLDVPDIS
mmetsp:Transcript_15049/g.18356  ORF Transcript_15049/g.18356 Transcript_15049/m.18356 type:complete len:699 (-) Transcript_15049:92-2188(-)